jgi:hypothetical protein
MPGVSNMERTLITGHGFNFKFKFKLFNSDSIVYLLPISRVS